MENGEGWRHVHNATFMQQARSRLCESMKMMAEDGDSDELAQLLLPRWSACTESDVPQALCALRGVSTWSDRHGPRTARTGRQEEGGGGVYYQSATGEARTTPFPGE